MDFRNDNNAFGIEYVKSALKGSLPSYLKDEETKDLTKVASSAFADEINREYPINSKKNTWQSIAYFYTQGKVKMASAKADEVEKQLMLASMVHGIKEDAKMCRHISCSYTGMLNIVKMSILMKKIYSMQIQFN